LQKIAQQREAERLALFRMKLRANEIGASVWSLDNDFDALERLNLVMRH